MYITDNKEFIKTQQCFPSPTDVNNIDPVSLIHVSSLIPLVNGNCKKSIAIMEVK
jgi:hypothetical protein